MTNVIDLKFHSIMRECKRGLDETAATAIELRERMQAVDLMSLPTRKRQQAIKLLAQAKIVEATNREDVSAALRRAADLKGSALTTEESLGIMRAVAPEAFIVRLV